VSRDELPAAVALNSVSFNIARAVGPALGGAVVAFWGPAAVFFLNAASFLGVISIIYSWDSPKRESGAPSEQVSGAIRAGARYTLHSPDLRAVLLRCSLFIVFSSALWALVPSVARHDLGLSSSRFGVLLGCLGLGALMGGATLPGIRQVISADMLVVAGSAVFAIATIALAYFKNVGVMYVVMVVAGVAWISIMASLNVAAQTAAPAWVRARAIGFYILAFQGGMAIASAVWGAIAAHAGSSVALVCASVGLMGSLVCSKQWPLKTGTEADLTPSLHWPEPHLVVEPKPEAGPILLVIEYRIDVKKSVDFVRATHAYSRIRKRDGALRWRLFRDLSDPGRYLELFIVESWAEHLRQHSRMTVADRDVEDRVRAFHIGSDPPVVSHFIYEPDKKADE
jgi:MFS family permease